MNKLYIKDLKNGDLIAPEEDLGWSFIDSTIGPLHTRVSTVGKRWSKSNSVGVYLGRVKLSERMDGLLTWHEVMIDGAIYLMEGYESSRIKKI